MVRYHMIKNCPVNVQDIKTMIDVYGPNVGALKGKTVRKRSHQVATLDYIEIPAEIQKIGKKIVIEADVIYIHRILFWFTMSRRLDF